MSALQHPGTQYLPDEEGDRILIPALRLRRAALAAAFTALAGSALAWGSEGHSIVAEIAQRRLTPEARAAVEAALGHHESLASVASWADDYRTTHAETARWHYVDLPLDAQSYDAARDCAADAAHGDCVVAELVRLKREIPCAPTREARRDALRLAVHFVGDIHQPLHTVGDARGGNLQAVSGVIRGTTCRDHCELGPDTANLHVLWDTTLIRRTVWNWGAYVERLEATLLRQEDIAQAAVQQDPAQWALQSHAAARATWNATLVPPDGHLDEAYYRAALPVLDRQLALAGVRLAAYLEAAFAEVNCAVAVQP